MDNSTKPATAELQSLRELFARPGSHCQHMLARGPHGSTSTNDPDATAWCLVGGIYHLYGRIEHQSPAHAVLIGCSRAAMLHELGQTLKDRGASNTSLVAWNDTTGRNRQNVLDLIDATTARLQQQG